MIEYIAQYCTREEKTKWCKRMARQSREFGGFYIGVAGCYIPQENTICLGREIAINARMHHEEDEVIRFLTDVICHEEDHRAIHEVTASNKTTLTFDLLFRHPFDFNTNREYFRLGGLDIFGKKLTSYGKMLVEKDNARRKMEKEQANLKTEK